jgi:hypothetical protein
LSFSSPSSDLKAWVSFNGTGTVAIRSSFNVSSITDGGTGDYSVNYTTAISDANYCYVLGAFRDNTGLIGSIAPTTANTAKLDVSTFNTSNTREDNSNVGVAIFR